MALVPEIKELIRRSETSWDSWKGKSGVELGTRLGMPSIIMSNLGSKLISIDGDDEVLQLLSKKAERKAASCGIEKMF